MDAHVFVSLGPLAGYGVAPAWPDPELTGPLGATTAVGTTAVDECRCGVLGYWWGANKRAASGYKNPKVLGGAGCGTTSERPRRGYSKRATLGGCTAELKS